MDHLEIEQFSPIGETPLLLLDARKEAAPYRNANAIIIGVDRDAHLDHDPTASFFFSKYAANVTP